MATGYRSDDRIESLERRPGGAPQNGELVFQAPVGGARLRDGGRTLRRPAVRLGRLPDRRRRRSPPPRSTATIRPTTSGGWPRSSASCSKPASSPPTSSTPARPNTRPGSSTSTSTTKRPRTRSPASPGTAHIEGAQHRLARRRRADQRLPPAGPAVRLRHRLLLRAHRARTRAGAGRPLPRRVGAAADPAQGAPLDRRLPRSVRALERGAAALRGTKSGSTPSPATSRSWQSTITSSRWSAPIATCPRRPTCAARCSTCSTGRRPESRLRKAEPTYRE